jgi:hypothetical protein
MLRSTEEILGFDLTAADGNIGKVKDLCFDDTAWVVRYFVADSLGWLGGRRILLAPEALAKVDFDAREVQILLSRQQIQDSPPIGENHGVSRRQQQLLAEYYDWTPYWRGKDDGAHGHGVPPDAEAPDAHLHGIREMVGCHIRAAEGDVGHIQDFLVQSDGWLLRYMVVDARDIAPGKKVLVSPAWIQRIDWPIALVHVDMAPDSIAEGPAFDPSQLVSRDYESRLHEHYGRRRYWEP